MQRVQDGHGLHGPKALPPLTPGCDAVDLIIEISFTVLSRVPCLEPKLYTVMSQCSGLTVHTINPIPQVHH